MTASSVHFKSTDGHKNIYNFSLKRINLPFLQTVARASRQHGAVLIVDASKYKVQPDSFSATLPIWCCVMNRLVAYYRHSLGINIHGESKWDDTLFTPPCISKEEHDNMNRIIDERVQSVVTSKVLLDPKAFVKTVHKPLRCFWVQNDSGRELLKDLQEVYSDVTNAQSLYSCIICISCSDFKRERRGRKHESGVDSKGGENCLYISGAGDDEEAWAKGLTPTLFWEHLNVFINNPNCTTDEETECIVDALVSRARNGNEEWFRAPRDDNVHRQCMGDISVSPFSKNCRKSSPKTRPCFTTYFDQIGSTYKETGIGAMYVGTRRAGRPPECWNYFDAIVNVTTMEYDELSSGSGIPNGKYYLQLPVKEGKRDRSELENWMGVALLFISKNLARGKRILIHCAQGMDRSVAVAMAALCIFYNFIADEDDEDGKEGSDVMFMYPWCMNIGYSSLETFLTNSEHAIHKDETHEKGIVARPQIHRNSGIPEHLVDKCKGREGRDLFLSYLLWLRSESTRTGSTRCPSTRSVVEETKMTFASKKTFMLALVFIQQYRAKACPTRSTMQKLNRFFMSGAHEK